jgi:hypothetical protein
MIRWILNNARINFPQHALAKICAGIEKMDQHLCDMSFSEHTKYFDPEYAIPSDSNASTDNTSTSTRKL